MSNLPTLNLVMLYVSDLNASLTYFTETLGFTHVKEEDTPTFRYLRGGQGGTDFAIRQATPDTPAPGMVELYFYTNDLAEVQTTLNGKGINTTPIMPRPFGQVFSFKTSDNQSITMVGQK